MIIATHEHFQFQQQDLKDQISYNRCHFSPDISFSGFTPHTPHTTALSMYIKIQKYDRLLNILCIKLDHSTHLGSDLSCPTYIVMVPPTCIMSVTNLCTVNHQHVYCQSPTCVLSVINLCTVSHHIVYCQSPTCVLSVGGNKGRHFIPGFSQVLYTWCTVTI